MFTGSEFLVKTLELNAELGAVHTHLTRLATKSAKAKALGRRTSMRRSLDRVNARCLPLWFRLAHVLARDERFAKFYTGIAFEIKNTGFCFPAQPLQVG